MATGPTTECLPCVFGAVATTLISAPFEVVGSVEVIVRPIVQVRNGTSVTVSTSSRTLTGDAPLPTSSFPGQSIVDITDAAGSLWTTLGTTLTFPTVYVQYLGFEGAGVSPALTACAQTIEPTAVNVPQGEPLSYLFPSDSSPQLPIALLEYLDANGVPAQLAGNQLTTCSPLPSVSNTLPSSTPPPSTPTAVTPITSSAVAPTTSIVSQISDGVPQATASANPSSSAASSISPSAPTPISESTDLTTVTTTQTTSTTVVHTSSFLTPTTIETTLPPPTTFTTRVPTTVVNSQVVPTTNAVTRLQVRTFATFSGPAIVTTPQNLPVMAPSVTESVSPTAAATRVSTSPTINLNNLFSAIFATTSPASSLSSLISSLVTEPTPASSLSSLLSSLASDVSETTTTITPTETTTIVITSTSSVAVVVTTGFENNATGSMTTMMGVGPVGSGTGMVPVGNGSVPSVVPFPGGAAREGAGVVLGLMGALMAAAVPMLLL